PSGPLAMFLAEGQAANASSRRAGGRLPSSTLCAEVQMPVKSHITLMTTDQWKKYREDAGIQPALFDGASGGSALAEYQTARGKGKEVRKRLRENLTTLMTTLKDADEGTVDTVIKKLQGLRTSLHKMEERVNTAMKDAKYQNEPLKTKAKTFLDE